MPLKVIGPRQWTLDTSADLLNQQSQPLVDAVQQQQQQIGQSQPQPSLESSIPSLEVLVGGGSQPQPSPAPSGLPQPQQGDFLSGIPSMDDLLKPLGLDSASRQAQQQQVTTPGIAPTRPTAASGTPAPMPQASASGAEYGPPAGSDSGVIEGADRPSRIASAYRYARAAEARTGVPAEVNLAFAVHESGLEDRYGPGNSFHGRHAVEGEDGTPITDWGYDANGNRVDYPTRLKSYKDASGSFNDFADLIASSPRYRPALDRYRQTGDKAQLVRDIWAAGYGESKTGPDETVDIMDRQVSPLAGQAPQPAPQRPQPATGAPQAMPSAAGEDLTPDQAALDDPDKWALCGPVAAVAMARARGGNWTVAQAKQYAVANGLWNADQGMGGLAAEAKLLNGMGVPASARGVDWNAITSDVQGGNPVTLSTTWVPGGHYVVLEKYDPQTGRFYVGGTGNTLKVTTGRSKWMTIGEMQQLGGIQGALHFDNPASPTPSVAATSPTAGSTPADSSSSAPATPSPTRTGVAGVVPDLNQGTGTQAALSFPMDTPPDGSGYQQPPEVLDRSQAQPSVEDAQRNGRTLIQGIAPDLAQGQGVQRAMTFPEQTPPPSSYNDPTDGGTQTQPLPTPVTSSYNDPTDQGTIAQPLPPQQLAYPSPADDHGVPENWLESARVSPVYKMVMKWKVALPLHPEYRTLPMVWYVPPLSPITGAANAGQMGINGEIPDVNQLRIPVKYLANLLTAGDTVPVVRALERMLAMRAHQRSKHVDGVPNTAALQQVDLSEAEVEDMYQLMAIANYEDRFVIPSTHREYAENAFDVRGGCGFSFGNGCSEGSSDTSLFGGGGRRTIPIKAEV